ncbi:MAG: hypothetical protein C0595_13490 [Marinilabiliales bacterium]|nr:MAG: hypothetical protein C0595_13490 [Marinilabiliales bacterium]
MNSKPKLKIPTERFDVVLDVVLLAFVLAVVIVPMYYLNLLPDKIPLHFNMKGNVDNYGNKYTIFMVSGISVVLAVSLWWIRRFPHLMNFPVQINEANARLQYLLAIRLLNVINILTTSIFLIIILLITNTALGYETNIYNVLLYINIAMMFVSMLIYFIRAGKLNKNKS